MARMRSRVTKDTCGQVGRSTEVGALPVRRPRSCAATVRSEHDSSTLKQQTEPRLHASTQHQSQMNSTCIEVKREGLEAATAPKVEVPVYRTPARSLPSPSFSLPSPQVCEIKYSGWMHKLSSGNAPRWQRRYWTLEGPKLSYAARPGAPATKEFDIRRAIGVAASPGLTKELQLDLGVRVWKLRADSDEDANGWKSALQAARNLPPGGDLLAGAVQWLDDDGVDSMPSTPGSVASSQSRVSASRMNPSASASTLRGPSLAKLGCERQTVSLSALPPRLPEKNAGVKLDGATSERSDKTVSTHAPSCTGVSEMRGWLQKLSTGPITGRWQDRHFELNGCELAYSMRPGDSTRRGFDLRALQQVKASADTSAEIELNLGWRTLRLRAESVEMARCWARALEAAKYGKVPDETHWETCSNDGSSVAVKTSRAPSQASSEPGTPTFGRSQGDFLKAFSLSAASPRRTVEAPKEVARPAVLDFDEAAATSRFEACFDETGPAECRRFVQNCRASFAALWVELGASRSRAFPDRIGAEAAAASLRASGSTEVEAVTTTVAKVLRWFGTQLEGQITLWLGSGDATADDLAVVAQWVLLEAAPALAHFQSTAAAHVSSAGVEVWPDILAKVQQTLLSEWEARRCDDVFKRCEADASLPTALQLLGTAARCGELWGTNHDACERSLSVLVATLNAVLRCQRARWRKERLQAAPEVPDVQQASEAGTPRDSVACCARRSNPLQAAFQRAGRALSRGPPSRSTWDCLMLQEVAQAAAEAAQLSDVCADTKVSMGDHKAVELANEMLVSFSAVFRREATDMCTVLAEKHFTHTHQRELRAIAFTSHRLKSVDSGSGVLTAVCSAATSFMDDLQPDEEMQSLFAQLLCTALGCLLSRRWVEAFCRAPPKRSSCPDLPDLIAADVDALSTLADTYSVKAVWAELPKKENPLVPLQEVQAILQDGAPELVGIGAARLEVLLEGAKGSELARAVRLCAAS